MLEADTYVRTQINIHSETDLQQADPELISLSSGLAASTFNYWQTPVKDQNLSAIKEWKKFIQDYILATYGKKNPNLLTGGETFGKTKGFS